MQTLRRGLPPNLIVTAGGLFNPKQLKSPVHAVYILIDSANLCRRKHTLTGCLTSSLLLPRRHAKVGMGVGHPSCGFN
jgi:hypothetical protein